MESKWVKYEDSMFVNEDTKEVVIIQTYGNNDEYFLSQSAYYENDPYEDLELNVVINDLLNNNYDDLVSKTKYMRDIDI